MDKSREPGVEGDVCDGDEEEAGGQEGTRGLAKFSEERGVM